VRHRRPRYRKSGLNPCMTATTARGSGSGNSSSRICLYACGWSHRRVGEAGGASGPGESHGRRRRSYDAYIPRGGKLQNLEASSSALDFYFLEVNVHVLCSTFRHCHYRFRWIAVTNPDPIANHDPSTLPPLPYSPWLIITFNSNRRPASTSMSPAAAVSTSNLQLRTES